MGRKQKPGTAAADGLGYVSEPDYRRLLSGAATDPANLTARLVLADWVQEHGDEEEAGRIRRGPLPLFSLAVATGTFMIAADWASLLWPYPVKDKPVEYLLAHRPGPDSAEVVEDPYEAARAVAEHRSGIDAWDSSGAPASDYLGDWRRHATEDHNRRLLRVFLAARPEADMAEVVRHFESARPGFFGRLELADLFRTMRARGELSQLPNMSFAPAEMRDLRDAE